VTLRCRCEKHQHQNPILTVKYGAGRIMVCGCFVASGPGQHAIINGKINLQVYEDILQKNLRHLQQRGIST
uniref:Uncharacterized protein n=1 Tax=Neogobius melanostomus TaxID=47308 RepID=A0A8C6T251_9GOBI